MTLFYSIVFFLIGMAVGLRQLNRLMIAEGWTRARRRSFWREFIGEADKVSKLESIERENKNV